MNFQKWELFSGSPGIGNDLSLIVKAPLFKVWSLPTLKNGTLNGIGLVNLDIIHNEKFVLDACRKLWARKSILQEARLCLRPKESNQCFTRENR